jgi:hypothetical protein
VDSRSDDEIDEEKLTQLYGSMVGLQHRLMMLLPEVEIEAVPPLSECSCESITSRLESLSELLPELEDEMPGEDEKEWGADEEFMWGMCDICGGIGSEVCKVCQKVFCGICMQSTSHQERHLEFS